MYAIKAFNHIAGESHTIGFFSDEVNALSALDHIESNILRMARPDDYECPEGLELKEEMARRITKSNAQELEFYLEKVYPLSDAEALSSALNQLTYMS
jgi:hypothetical protein